MKRVITITVLLALVATSAWAVSFSGVKDWLTGTAVALLLTGLLAIGIIAKYTDWISGILTAVGWFCVTIGNAASDHKITKDELADIKAKWNDVRQSVKNRPADG